MALALIGFLGIAVATQAASGAAASAVAARDCENNLKHQCDAVKNMTDSVNDMQTNLGTIGSAEQKEIALADFVQNLEMKNSLLTQRLKAKAKSEWVNLGIFTIGNIILCLLLVLFIIHRAKKANASDEALRHTVSALQHAML